MHMYRYSGVHICLFILFHFPPLFLSPAMTYRILVVGEGKHFGLSTACLYINLAGDCGETGVYEIPRGEYQTEITVSIFWQIW